MVVLALRAKEKENMIEYIDRIWIHFKFYSDLLHTANRLHEEGESYAAFLVLFNVLELICKSVRESDDSNVVSDIKWMAENGLVTATEEEFLNGQNGIRKIRNIMTHKDPYAYFFNDEKGIVHSFADAGSWDLAYDLYAPATIKILCHAIENKNA